MTEDRKKALCFTCLYRDARPEVGVGDQLLYCMKKERVVSPKMSCALYTRATERAKESLRHSLYGSFNDEDEVG
ncbi:MAG: hypothetical protein LUQ39_05485 [Methanomassiliicoccales archaeon]|nr:hypothetical protein [Methanomassiliicoccales archaeon]